MQHQAGIAAARCGRHHKGLRRAPQVQICKSCNQEEVVIDFFNLCNIEKMLMQIKVGGFINIRSF